MVLSLLFSHFCFGFVQLFDCLLCLHLNYTIDLNDPSLSLGVFYTCKDNEFNQRFFQVRQLSFITFGDLDRAKVVGSMLFTDCWQDVRPSDKTDTSRW